MATFEPTFETIGLLFIPTSGRTAFNTRSTHSEIHLFTKVWAASPGARSSTMFFVAIQSVAAAAELRQQKK